MKKSVEKITAMFLAFVLCLSIGANSVYASENFNTANIEDVILAKEHEPVQLRSAGTKAVKKAIKWALRHSDDLIRSAAKWIGKDAAKVIEKNLWKATPVLSKLLEYDDLVWQTVQDQLTHVVGKQAAIWIRMALEWLL